MTRSLEENKQLSQLLFPKVEKTVEDYEKIYPKRQLNESAKVTRFAPSPTGFVHIGGLFSALISERIAHQSEGIFYLRIEDTDKKREIDHGIEGIVDSLKNFGINIDEGYISESDEIGAYKPYKQSERMEIYHTFIKSLIEQDKAYPCFSTTEELEQLRKNQEDSNITPGYYGEFAIYRNKSFVEIKEKLDANIPFVIRLKSTGSPDRKISYKDIIKGNMEFPENIQDIVICKSDSLPTYHFAHAIDDHVMGTTHVIRGDEWLPSVPVHLQLFYTLGWKAPKYGHIPPILKQDGNSKRKLSKRKDPEAAVSFYHQEGYPTESVLEYLLNLANSSFEDWRKVNSEKSWNEFPFKAEKIGVSGALFDLVKLTDVSKNAISRMSAQDVYHKLLDWSKKYDQEYYSILFANKENSLKMINIERENKKPRRDISKWSEVKEYFSYMYDELYKINDVLDFPENVTNEDIKIILNGYVNIYNHNDTKEEWFNRIKDFSNSIGFATDMKDYKANPDNYKGSITDTTTVIRVAITGRKQGPDIYEIMNILGTKKVTLRLNVSKN
ncbi:MAG: glutamate--tRNA ligase [Candidatus Sericytochromatia bacterium]|nr:glutamate--tRNA ligase [Candidatus Sericytochromatia bacterium]